MAETSKRRGLRFSLRAVFLAFTVLAIFLGLISTKVRDRQRAAKNTRLYWASESTEQMRKKEWRYLNPSIPWYRKLMGDRAYRWVQVDDSATDEELANAERLFPEAIVIRNRNPNLNYRPAK